MKRSKLKELTLLITDGEHGTVIDEKDTNYFLLSNKNIINGNIIISFNDRTISKKTLDKIRRRTHLEKGDLLISTVGTIGKTAVIKDNDLNFDFQRSVGIIKCDQNKILPEYLYYYLTTSLVQERLMSLSKGVIQKCLYIDDIKNLIIDYPESIEEQKSITSSLKNIDNMIERNNTMVQKLLSFVITRYRKGVFAYAS